MSKKGRIATDFAEIGAGGVVDGHARGNARTLRRVDRPLRHSVAAHGVTL
jgi:hypothetical protein